VSGERSPWRAGSAGAADTGWYAVRRFSFGSTAAIVTSIGLIVGFNAASASKQSLVGGLVIVAIADNLADSLSIHVYQESERLASRSAFITTVTNFVTRLVVASTFIVIIVTLPLPAGTVVASLWGLALLVALTFLIARDRGVRPLPEVVKHIIVACIVIASSEAVGAWIPA